MASSHTDQLTTARRRGVRKRPLDLCRERVFTTRRDVIKDAWEANKRHVRAIADKRAIANYGIRKEMTFSLSAILKEWSEGSFDAERNPHTGPAKHTIDKNPHLILGRDPAAMHDSEGEMNPFNKLLHDYAAHRQSRTLMHERLSRLRPKRRPRHILPFLYWEKANLETSLERWRRLAEVNILDQLKALVGGQAEFRSVQERSMRAIMKRANPVLVVMGTGAGKSMCFMLPASCSPGGVTIVVVTLTSLQGDLHDRCGRMGIASIIWNSRRPHDTAPLIFVTPESALSGTLGGLVTRLVGAHQLERVVVNECHTVLDSTKDFRPKLRELGDLSLYGVRMVYLTATLLKSELRRLRPSSLVEVDFMKWYPKIFHRALDTRTFHPSHAILKVQCAICLEIFKDGDSIGVLSLSRPNGIKIEEFGGVPGRSGLVVSTKSTELVRHQGLPEAEYW
ncbi:hypothetical protein PWT90_03521 [Aphanocladium album]|nr:hypothetical protein PWT90_03521 [Aphanocladium album]